MALFGLVMAMVLETLVATGRYANHAVLEDTLSVEGERVLDAVTADFAGSAWLISADTDLDLLAADPDYDREGARYYPYVTVQDYSATPYAINGLPDTSAWYAEHIRDPDELVQAEDLLASKPGLPAAHLVPSQELIFLRVRAGAASNDPELAQDRWINFEQPAVPLSEYDDVSNPDLPRLDSLALVESAGEIDDVPLAWETYPTATPWDSDLDGDGVNDPDPEELREYTYVVVPGPSGAQLERRYRDGDGAPLRLERVISTDVDRIQIDSYRTAADLGVNQLRVRVWLSRPSRDQSEVPITHYAERIIAMRSTVDPEYSLRLDDWLGTAGEFDL